MTRKDIPPKPDQTTRSDTPHDHHLPTLNWLRGFEATARIGSFTAAAEALGLTQAAVSYQVRALEKHLGFPLFERQAHGVKLTEMGKAYLPSVQKAFDEISAATVGLFGPIGQASLAVRTPPSFAALWLAPKLNCFRQAYPSIPIRLYSAIWGTALPSERVDVEIRVGIGDWPGFSSEPLDDGPVIAVGRRRSGAERPAIRALADVAEDTLIEIMEVDDAWTRLLTRSGLPAPARERIVRVDSSLVALELAAAGVGHALVLKRFAERYLHEGKLVDLLGLERPPSMSHYILRPLEHQRQKPEAKLFIDWLKRDSRSEEPLAKSRA